MPRFQININGTSPLELYGQWTRVQAAADELRRALDEAAPHGRDYQTVMPNGNEAFGLDRADWRAHAKEAGAIAEYAAGMMLEVHDQMAARRGRPVQLL